MKPTSGQRIAYDLMATRDYSATRYMISSLPNVRHTRRDPKNMLIFHLAGMLDRVEASIYVNHHDMISEYGQ